MKHLFLDDIRMPSDVTWVDIGSVDWDVVRSYDEAISWVLQNGFPDSISFDHDLGYESCNILNSGIAVVTNANEEKSGYDFAKWLIDYDMETNSMPHDFKFVVHSMNPIGAKNIQTLLDNYLKHK